MASLTEGNIQDRLRDLWLNLKSLATDLSLETGIGVLVATRIPSQDECGYDWVDVNENELFLSIPAGGENAEGEEDRVVKVDPSYCQRCSISRESVIKVGNKANLSNNLSDLPKESGLREKGEFVTEKRNFPEKEATSFSDVKSEFNFDVVIKEEDPIIDDFIESTQDDVECQTGGGSTKQNKVSSRISGDSEIMEEHDGDFSGVEDLSYHLNPLGDDLPFKSPLECGFCGKVLSSKRRLKYHERFHTGENALKCKFCEKMYYDPNTFKNHTRDCKERTKIQENSEEKLDEDLAQALKKLYQCTVCSEEFPDYSKLKKHKAKHTEDADMSCKVCGKRQTCLKRLKVHMRTHTGEKPFECLDCGKAFSESGGLSRHRSVHTDEKLFKCDVCGKEFKRYGTLKLHIRIHNENPFQCDICQKGFSSQGALKKHSVSHTGEKPHLCTICGKTFARTDKLNDHLTTTHNMLKPFTCDQCGRGFSMSCYLIKHQRQSCRGASFKCDTCTKEFSTAAKLEIHSRVHSGEKPYQCNECGMKCSQLSSLKSHRLTHSNERPFKCDVCEKDFKSIALLREHSRIHTGEKPYKCDTCSMEFSSVKNFHRHKKIHKGKKPYNCGQCGKDFFRSDHLKQHQMTHTGEKPWKCSLCARAFSESRSLKKHLLSHSANCAGSVGDQKHHSLS